MKKSNILWTMALAAALSAGMALTAFAGWSQQDGKWYYYKDTNNEMVRDDWVKTGDAYYYLNKDGVMLTDSFVDETYYVDGNGVMVVNDWRMITGDRSYESGWRYFGSNGRVFDSGLKQIGDTWYHFTDTVMDTGWIGEDDKTYYFNESGAMATGWKKLHRDEDDWGEYWFYFGSTSGKLIAGCEKKIDNITYAFDDEGRMLTGWVNLSDFTSSELDNLSSRDVSSLKYFKKDGSAVNGWQYLPAPDDTEENWYFFKDGKAYSSDYKTTEVGQYGMARIENEIYCFDDEGRMVTGLVELNDERRFYFDENTGRLRTGRVMVTDDNYENQEFCFATSGSVGRKGEGVTGEKDERLYDNGILVTAEEGMKYAKVEVDGNDYVVNEQGRVKTSGTVTDGDGVRYHIEKKDGKYIITVKS